MDEYAKYLEEKKAKPKGLSTFKLKVIGDVLMFLSAASMTLVPRFLGAPSTDDMGVLTVVVLCEAISWVAIPIYAWLLYMGFDRTRSWFKYGMRLFILALVCEVPYDMVTFGPDHLFDFRSQNPVFGLVVALVVMVLLDAVEDLKTGGRVTLSVLLVIIGLLWDVLLRVGQSQAILNIGSLTLGFCVIYYYLHLRENTMMIPAATLGAVSGIAPGFGVYATRVVLPDGARPAVTNVGVRPTVSSAGRAVIVEPWILDYRGDLYGRDIRVEFHARLRPERKFPSLQALRDAIGENAAQTRAYFAAKEGL